MNIFDFSFVLMVELDLQTFPLQNGIKVKEDVIPDSFRGLAFVISPRKVLALEVSSDAAFHFPNTRSRQYVFSYSPHVNRRQNMNVN